MDALTELTERRSRLGFREGEKGTHSSRTLMLEELETLLQFADESMTPADYRRLVFDENILGKPTRITRDKTSTILRTLYGLDPAFPVFRVLLHLWPLDPQSRPMLALLAAYARDPILRALTPVVLTADMGSAVGAKQIIDEIDRTLSGRFSRISEKAIASRVLSTFTQSGHLEGRTYKRRTRAHVSPVSAAYAFFLAYLDGFRAQRIFTSPWTRLLDVHETQLPELGYAAARLGLIDYRQVGDVYDLRFPNWLTPIEAELTRG